MCPLTDVRIHANGSMVDKTKISTCTCIQHFAAPNVEWWNFGPIGGPLHSLWFPIACNQAPQCQTSAAKTIKVRKYVNMVAAAQREEEHQDVFCPGLANPQHGSKLESLMTSSNAQMVNLWRAHSPLRSRPGASQRRSSCQLHTCTQSQDAQIRPCQRARAARG